MPTLAPGPTDTASQGFSLVEALVVVLIIGIITSVATLSAWHNRTDARLLQDAQRLAQLLSLAHREARAWDLSIQWHHDEQGYWFEASHPPLSGRSSRSVINPVPVATFQTGALRHRYWRAPEHLRIGVEPGMNQSFTADWLSGPERIVLSDGHATLHIQRNTAGLYEVIR